MMHGTLQKFNAAETTIKEYKNWVLLLRPRQPMIGAAVICIKDDVRSFPELSAEALSELKQVTGDYERAIGKLFQPKKFNYICLMLVDPQFHFHVFPRYDTPQLFDSKSYVDVSWPGVPDVLSKVQLPPDVAQRLKTAIATEIPK